MSRLTLAALLCLLATGAMAEEYYKWKDENGVWNYTTTPPKDKSSTTVNIATGATAATVPAGPQEAGAAEAPGGAAKPPAAERQQSADGTVTNTPAETIAKARQAQSANCEQARTNVATLENNARVQIGDKALSEDEQMQELMKARRQVEVFCNSR